MHFLPPRARRQEDRDLSRTLVAMKKPAVFIDAVAKARAQDSQVTGLLIGDGPQRQELEQRARARGLGMPSVF